VKSLWLAYAVLACLAVAPRIVAQATSATKGSGTLEQNAITNEKALIEAKKKDDTAFFRAGTFRSSEWTASCCRAKKQQKISATPV
jgi:hypothetical protein